MTGMLGNQPSAEPRRAGRPPVSVTALVEVAMGLLPAMCRDGLRATVIDPFGATPVISVEEDERRLRLDADVLARQMTQARVEPTGRAISDALNCWLRRRPVTDAQARAHGVAILDWTDPQRPYVVGWRVAVPRGGRAAVPWRASPGLCANSVHQIRSAALGRAFTAGATMRVAGDAAIWSHPDCPPLATATIVDPQNMQHAMGRAGLPRHGQRIIIAPGRPVVAVPAAGAARLTDQCAEPHVVVGWRALTDLEWV